MISLKYAGKINYTFNSYTYYSPWTFFLFKAFSSYLNKYQISGKIVFFSNFPQTWTDELLKHLKILGPRTSVQKKWRSEFAQWHRVLYKALLGNIKWTEMVKFSKWKSKKTSKEGTTSSRTNYSQNGISYFVVRIISLKIAFSYSFCCFSYFRKVVNKQSSFVKNRPGYFNVLSKMLRIAKLWIEVK